MPEFLKQMDAVLEILDSAADSFAAMEDTGLGG
jgi:hypothetical protein